MKVAIVVEEFPAISQTFVLQEIIGLLQAGHDVRVFAARGDTDVVHPEVEKYGLVERTTYRPSLGPAFTRPLRALPILLRGIKHAPIATLQSLNPIQVGGSAFNLRALYACAPFFGKPHQFDVIYCHFGPAGAMAATLLRIGLIKGPLIVKMHAVDIVKLPRLSRANYYKLMFSRASRILVVSKYMREKVIALGATPESVFVHSIGVEIPKALAPKPHQNKNVLQILTVARLVEKKGIEYCIRAIAHIRKDYPHIKFRYLVVGDGPDRAKLISLVHQLKLQHVVSLLGKRTNDEVTKLMQKADVFVLPSVTAADGDQEGTPTVIAEAMAIGLPVISTWHSGIPEQIDHEVSGILVPERDVSSLAGAIMKLATDLALRQRLCAAAHRAARTRFDIHKLNWQLIHIHIKQVQEQTQKLGVRIK